MDAPIRYKPVGYDQGMEPAHDGPYILAAEHERLMAEVIALRARVAELEAARIRLLNAKLNGEWTTEARNEALEDAAKVAEKFDGFHVGSAHWPAHIAAAIRAMKER